MPKRANAKELGSGAGTITKLSIDQTGLLISTLVRSVNCELNENVWKVNPLPENVWDTELPSGCNPVKVIAKSGTTELYPANWTEERPNVEPFIGAN
jgi:hypothetical protein